MRDVINGLHTREGGTISAGIINTFQSKLDDETDRGKAAKLGKYDEVTSIYNKALLTSIVVPIIDTVR